MSEDVHRKDDGNLGGALAKILAKTADGSSREAKMLAGCCVAYTIFPLYSMYL
jgi:hypothetical protein